MKTTIEFTSPLTLNDLPDPVLEFLGHAIMIASTTDAALSEADQEINTWEISIYVHPSPGDDLDPQKQRIANGSYGPEVGGFTEGADRGALFTPEGYGVTLTDHWGESSDVYKRADGTLDLWM